jgi:Uma2 family endonuclease
MSATIASNKKQAKSAIIPESFVYEVMNGQPIYYENYQSILKNDQNIEAIIGSGYLQVLITKIIYKFLLNRFDEQGYEVFSGEAGLHLSQNDNLAIDIMMYDSEALASLKPDTKYLNIPPKLVVEIDTAADSKSVNFANYYYEKTQKLLDFGVERVIWVY